jgi:hypothetical protein
MPSQDDLHEIKSIIEEGFKQGIFAEGEFGQSYCRACGTKHRKLWFSLADGSLPFYVCLVAEPFFVMKVDGEYESFKPNEFGTILGFAPPGSATLRSFWERAREHPLMPKYVTVRFTGQSPWLEVEFTWETR